MLLTIDIGNTTIDLAVSQKKRIKRLWSIEMSQSQKALRLDLTRVVRRVKREYPDIERIIICSVVPRALSVTKALLKRTFKVEIIVTGVNRKIPIANRYRNPRQVGQDRLLCAYAAMRFYGYPVIVIDLGTAITFDVVSSRREYLGGIIVPGIRLSAESLFKKTAMLPKVGIKIPNALIGRDTETSILSGLFHGYGVLCQGLIDLISKNRRHSSKVVMTGGYAASMKTFISYKKPIIDEHLVHKGMISLSEVWDGSSK